MKTYKKGTLIIKRYKKGMTIVALEANHLPTGVALTEEEIKILKEYFKENL